MLSLPTKPKPPAAAPLAKRNVSRRFALAGLLLGLSLAAPARAQTTPMQLNATDQQLVSQVESYLNEQTGLTANFLQVAWDGSTRTGKAWLQRPGRMRFEYDPPDPELLVAGFGMLVYHDPALNQTSYIPLDSTPLGILLATHVNLTSADVAVTGIDREPGEYDITLIRKNKAAQGTLTLVFGTNPLQLRQWVVTDAQGKQTRVSLYDALPGGPYPDKLFQYNRPASPAHHGG